MKNITIVGGGTSGLVSALILKARFSSLDVNIIKSDNIGIIGVGEGTTEHWDDFCGFCDIKLSDLLNKTDATFKYGVMFEGWMPHNFYHMVTGEISDINVSMTSVGYLYATINNMKPEEYTHKYSFYNKLLPSKLSLQYHFDTYKLNKFLLDICIERGVKVYDGLVTDVEIENDKITKLKIDSDELSEIVSDFYIDSTGFSRILISKLGSKWESYEKYLPMNEAIAFPTALNDDNYPPYTLSKKMKAGWMWRIPTQKRWGNGYVFNNTLINAEEAKLECENYLGHTVDIQKNIKFNAGKLNKAWISNCVAIGLSSNFVEPLEASSIGISINQVFLLSHFLINYTDKDIELYNDKFNIIMENVRDFIVLHYLKSNFKFDIPESLKNNLKKWKYRLPVKEDFGSNYVIFREDNFTILLKELGIFDIESLKREYYSLNELYREKVVEPQIESFTQKEENYFQFALDHKEVIRKLINPV